jgi:hypothetical protein
MAVFRPALDQLNHLLAPLNAGECRIALELARQLDWGWTCPTSSPCTTSTACVPSR